MNGAQFKLEVEARIANLEVIDAFIEDAVARLGAEGEAYRVQLAVNEACTNIIQYAYGGDTNQPIRIACSKADGDLVVRIKDEGERFEPDSVPAPDTESGVLERKPGGLGIFLMRKMMHDVEFIFHYGGHNELIMKRHLSREG
jgi:serine/threonine-protein kinase RsbW